MSFVGKADSITYGRAALNYAENKELEDKHVAHELSRQFLGGNTSQEILLEMERWREVNHYGNIKRGYFWLSFNPSKEVIQQLDTHQKWEAAHNKWLSYMGLDNTQRVVIMHDGADNDTERSHLHALLNRVDLDGNLISDSFIYKRAKAAAEKLAREYKLKTADELGKDKRAIVREKALNALKSLKNVNMVDFYEACKVNGLSVMVRLDGKGYSLGLDGDDAQPMKVSAIDRELTIHRITQTFNKLKAAEEKERAEEAKWKALQEKKEQRGKEQLKQVEKKKNGKLEENARPSAGRDHSEERQADRREQEREEQCPSRGWRR